MTLTLTILGCGSSGGVPRIGNDWGVCDPQEPKNRRRRCSVMLEQKGPDGTTRVVIDTSPDLRDQMLSANVKAIDGVWYTHEHADHTHGIDELRVFFLRQRQRVPIWADEPTADMLHTRFAYCFESAVGSDYPPIVERRVIEAGSEITTQGQGGAISGLPFTVHHGNIDALGFRIGATAYTPDLNDIPESSLPYLQGLDLWIVDALRPKPHPSHFSLPETLDWIKRLNPKRAILTNMHVDLDYQTLLRDLPAHITPAYDGMPLEI
ncbi:MAG: MBL fold metallo-hydrolase [Alphaproteobacteria bacterium]|nr:MBL fold metallo-hydrolase [Alphaproteobacteria bacterium]